MKTALVLVDIQNDYFPGGKNPLPGSPEAAERAAAVLASFRAAGYPVFHVRHEKEGPAGAHFLRGTEGAEIHRAVTPIAGEIVITKHFPNSFRETVLEAELRQAGIDSLVICGMQTNMCVEAAVRAAADLGFIVTVADDACAARDLVFRGVSIPAATVHAAFLAAMSGAYAKVTTATEIIVTLPK